MVHADNLLSDKTWNTHGFFVFVFLIDNVNWYLWSILCRRVNSKINWSHPCSKETQSSEKSAAAAKSLQSCPTLYDPRDGSPHVPGILQARTLEWVAISFSNAWKWKVKVKSLSRVWLLATLWTAAHQAPPSMGFSREEYWSGCRCLLQVRNLVNHNMSLQLNVDLHLW